MSDTAETFQLTTEAAEVYEQKFVPALFAEWAEYLVDAVGPRPGQSVLDVACGTGIVARTAAERLGGGGRVAGVDLNEGMLEVARRIRRDLEWRRGDAGDLPFADESFDAVLCQASVMYFPDRVQALKEMGRVAIPEGVVGVQVWGSLENQPAYQRLGDVLARHVGPEGEALVVLYFSLGELDLVTGLFDEAGLKVTTTQTRRGTVRFSSIDDFARGELTPLADRIDAQVYDRIVEDCRKELAEFVAPDGRTEIPIEGHLITARKG